MKNCSIRQFKRANMLAGKTAKRWLKVPESSKDKNPKYNKLANLYDKAASRLFNLSYTIID